MPFENKMASTVSNRGSATGSEKGSGIEDSKGKQSDKQKSDNFHVVYIVFMSLLIDLLAFTVILPLLPSILEYYERTDKSGYYSWILKRIQTFRDSIGAPHTDKLDSVLFGGALGSLFSFLQFLSSPIFGALSDVYGRKPILLLTLVGISISYGIWVSAGSFTVFVLARIIGGISKGNVSMSTAIVTDVTAISNRAKGMAFIGVAFSVGFVVGPTIGAVFSHWSRSEGDIEGESFWYPAMFALILSLINILFVLRYYKETLPEQKRATSISSGLLATLDYINPVALFKFRAVRDLNTSDLSGVQRIGVVYFLYLFLYSGLEFTLTFLTRLRFNFNSMQQGKMFFFIGIIMALVQGGYVRRVKVGMERKIAVRGLMIIIPAFVIIGVSHSLPVFYFGLALYSFSSGTVVPCLTSMVSDYGQDSQKGVVVGIFRSLGALARAMGPIVASIGFWTIGAFRCYCIGAVLLTIPLLMLGKVGGRRKVGAAEVNGSSSGAAAVSGNQAGESM